MTRILPGVEAGAYLQELGGKARGLFHATEQGLPVPPWGIVLPDPISSPEELAQELLAFIATHFPTPRFFAVRSSALTEDGQEHSFAGMLESFLFVPPQDLARRVLEVRASASSDRVRDYAAALGVPFEGTPPAVILQEMIPAEKSGVAFSTDPMQGITSLSLISATWGLGSGLVSGECEADSYSTHQHREIVQSRISCKTHCHQHNAHTGEVSSRPVEEILQKLPCLSPDEIVRVSELTHQAAQVFASPQDIEWCIAQGRLYLLQSRPITRISPVLNAMSGQWHEWDNAPTIESWPGVSTPQTFALAHRLLKATYQAMARYTCLPKVGPQEIERMCQQLTGSINGHILLDSLMLQSLWFQAPAIDYRINSFTSATQTLQEKIRRVSSGASTEPIFLSEILDWLGQGMQSVRGICKLVWYYGWLDERISRFSNRINSLLRVTPKSNSPQSLWKHLNKLQRAIDQYWDTPTLNTFFATQLLSWGANPQMTVTSPGKRLSYQFQSGINTLSDLARAEPAFAAGLQHSSQEEITNKLQHYSPFQKQLERFLDIFGDRGPEDMKLESLPWRENPLPLYRLIGTLAQQPAGSNIIPVSPTQTPPTKDTSWIHHWLTRQYHARIATREELRLQATRLVGAIRRDTMALGTALCQQNLLPEARDILFLADAEIKAMALHLQPVDPDLLAQRKSAYQQHLDMPDPPDRFRAWGPFGPDILPTASLETGPIRNGQGCSPGVISGEICWLNPGTDITCYQGKILAAPYGDPSLVSYFPLIKGLILERGSTLSHAAIVARELQVPTVLGLPGLSTWLAEGDSITMDGGTGRVEKITDG